jgi:hypothetical protein
MDIPEMAAKQIMAADPKEYEEEYEEGIMLRASNLLHFQDTLVDIRSQIRDIRSQFIDLQRDARQDRLEVQEMFRAILDRPPPASGPLAPPSAS